MAKNVVIAVLPITAFVLALKLIQCRHELKLSQLEEAKTWSVYEVCLQDAANSRGAK
jgi:hypothetical protein